MGGLSRDEVLVAADAEVEQIARAAAAAGRFAFDLEFVSESRYVPELALVQVAWEEGGAQRIAAIDPLAADPRPIFDLVEDERVEVVAHAAKQDLGLLAERFEVEARGIHDTQIGAAFAGLGEQIGYAKLVERLFGIAIDKGHQFTDWMRRPLSPEQARYALDDVRHLLPAWDHLHATLAGRGRLEWVREECARAARAVLVRKDPEEMYRHVGGWNALRGPALGSLRALAAWREREARRDNKPPSWILPDGAMADLCRRQAGSEADLRRARGVGAGTIRAYGRAILDAIASGAKKPPPAAPARRGSGGGAGGPIQAWAAIVASMIQARCAAEELPTRFVGTRADAEDLVLAFTGKIPEEDAELLGGWRRELIGADALAWLRGERAIAVDEDSPGGLLIVERK